MNYIWVTSKLTIVNKVSCQKDHKRKIIVSAYIQYLWTTNNTEMIYFDEFSLNGRYNDLYGWTIKGKKGYVAQTTDNFQMGFIVGFSRKWLYGIMETKNTVDSKLVI